MLSHFSFRDKCVFPCSFSGTAPVADFESTGFSAGRMVKKDGTVSPEYHVNDYLCSVRVVADAQNIANLSLRAGFDVSHFRLFFEQHFNTDKARASFFGLTYYF